MNSGNIIELRWVIKSIHAVTHIQVSRTPAERQVHCCFNHMPYIDSLQDSYHSCSCIHWGHHCYQFFLCVISFIVSVAAMSCVWSSLLLFIYIGQSESSTEFTQTKSPSVPYKYHTAYHDVASAVRCSLYCTQLSRCDGFTYHVTTSTCSLIRGGCIDYSAPVEKSSVVVTYMKEAPAPTINSTLARSKN